MGKPARPRVELAYFYCWVSRRDLTAAEPCLDTARAHLTDASAARQPGTLASHYDEALFSVRTAICYAEAGCNEVAVDLFTAVLTPTMFARRDYGYFLAVMAQAVGRLDRPDAASTAGTTALAVAVAVAQSTGSVRTVNEVIRLGTQLRPWGDRPAVRTRRSLLPA